MRRTSALALIASLACAGGLLAGCGSSGSDGADTTTSVADSATTTEASESTVTEADATTTVAEADDQAICEPLKALGESDAEANQLVAGGDWAKIQAFYVDQTDDIVAIYDEAIALDTEITPQLETLRKVTVSAGDLAAESSGLMEFSGKLSSQPGLTESGQAALEANDFAKETCGFALAGF